jgi:hypothetical protein
LGEFEIESFGIAFAIVLRALQAFYSFEVSVVEIDWEFNNLQKLQAWKVTGSSSPRFLKTNSISKQNQIFLIPKCFHGNQLPSHTP